jgi:hypothetical protein
MNARAEVPDMIAAVRHFAFMLAFSLVACTEEPAPLLLNGQEPSLPATETSRDFGDYILHFNAISTEELTPQIAQQYGIVRSANRGMLNVTILRKNEGGMSEAVPGSVAANAINLTAQLKNLNFREITEGDAIYYIAEFPISDEETLIFSIDATPINEPSRFSVRYKRQFFID